MAVSKKRVLIVGGGAAGLTAAIFASLGGAEVVILEKEARVGKKLLMTGNGRCNLSNLNACGEKYNNEIEVNKIFNEFGVSDTIKFFESLGLMTYSDEEGRVYPITDAATSVLDVLRLKCESLGVNIICNYEVKEIIKNQKFTIKGTGDDITCDSVIIATGGGMFDIVNKLGHTTTRTLPSLSGLKTKKDNIIGLSGVRANALVTLKAGDKVYSETGEVIFKDEGISGIVILNMSAHLARLEKSEGTLSLNFLPKLSHKELYEITSFLYIKLRYD